MSVGFLLLLSGVMKMLTPNSAANLFVELGLNSFQLSKLLGILFSIVEIFLAISLFLVSESLLVNIISVIIFSIFLLVNIKSLTNKEKKSCSCFGKLLKTELGYGGIVQSLIMLIIVFLNIGTEKPGFLMLVNNKIILHELILVVIVSVLGTITLIFIRSTIDTINNNLLGKL